jgi:hypothetical protein
MENSSLIVCVIKQKPKKVVRNIDRGTLENQWNCNLFLIIFNKIDGNGNFEVNY